VNVKVLLYANDREPVASTLLGSPMNRTAPRLLIALLLLAGGRAQAIDLSYTFLGGFQGGGAGRVEVSADHLFHRLPLGLVLGIGHAWVDPGDPALARQVFINDATNGTPEKSGGVWDLRLDAVWWSKVGWLDEFGFYGGIRYSMFSGEFRYVGGDEDFTVTSNAWGIGAGVRGGIAINRHWGLSGSVGLDWFPQQTIYGHDASYSSDGTIVNQRQNFTWADANRAINQPWLQPTFLFGVVFRP
jgi:hypothetical protein